MTRKENIRDLKGTIMFLTRKMQALEEENDDHVKNRLSGSTCMPCPSCGRWTRPRYLRPTKYKSRCLQCAIARLNELENKL